MALIERYHVVAAVRDVATSQIIKEGQIVSLDTNGRVVIQSNTNKYPYGLAGDTKNTASSMPGIGTAIIGADAAGVAITASFQNRVSDYFDETKASNKMTVYHSGGEFATDMFASNVATAAIMAPLYGVNGQFETFDTHSSGVIVARLIKADGAYPSGVPGTDINGDIAMGGENGNTYIEVKLVI